MAISIEPGISSKTHISAWLSGGSSIIRRSEFLRLGGFDAVYEPFYFEDLDTLVFVPGTPATNYFGNLPPLLNTNTNQPCPKNPILLTYVKGKEIILSMSTGTLLVRPPSAKLLFSTFRVFSGPNYIKIILGASASPKKYPPSIVFPALTDLQVFPI